MNRFIDKKSNYAPFSQDRTRILINFDPQDAPTPGYVTFSQVAFNKRQYPNLTLQQIKDAVFNHINEDVKTRILSGFIYDGHHIWLSLENQTNYKTAYDLAIQTSGDSLPYTIRVGSDDSNPDYLRFGNRTDFTAFYQAMVAHIQHCLTDGWALKDSIDWTLYSPALSLP